MSCVCLCTWMIIQKSLWTNLSKCNIMCNTLHYRPNNLIITIQAYLVRIFHCTGQKCISLAALPNQRYLWFALSGLSWFSTNYKHDYFMFLYSIHSNKVEWRHPLHNFFPNLSGFYLLLQLSGSVFWHNSLYHLTTSLLVLLVVCLLVPFHSVLCEVFFCWDSFS